MKKITPTQAQFEAFDKMFSYYNKELFKHSLPQVLLNLSRLNRAHGFFAPGRWKAKKGKIHHEISLNPQSFKDREAIQVVSTLVHEMVHLWQQIYGTPSRTGYHNREWAKKMEEVGLIPSDTAAPGGKKTGQRVSHYVEADGPFETAFKKMPQTYYFPFVGLESHKRGRKTYQKNKIKYSCPCGINVWGKPELNILCGECGEAFQVAW